MTVEKLSNQHRVPVRAGLLAAWFGMVLSASSGASLAAANAAPGTETPPANATYMVALQPADAGLHGGPATAVSPNPPSADVTPADESIAWLPALSVMGMVTIMVLRRRVLD